MKIKANNAFVVSVNGCITPTVFTSLRSLCAAFQLNYSTASKGRLVFAPNGGKDGYTVIHPCDVDKIKGRTKNFESNPDTDQVDPDAGYIP